MFPPQKSAKPGKSDDQGNQNVKTVTLEESFHLVLTQGVVHFAHEGIFLRCRAAAVSID
jgi:hypothetical protein